MSKASEMLHEEPDRSDCQILSTLLCCVDTTEVYPRISSEEKRRSRLDKTSVWTANEER